MGGVTVAHGLGPRGLIGIHFLLRASPPIALVDPAWATQQQLHRDGASVFVLMRAFLLRSGASDDLFAALVRWIGRLPGEPSHAGIVAWLDLRRVSIGSSLIAGVIPGIVWWRAGWRGEERARLWAGLVARELGYAEYQGADARRIPVVVLDPEPGT